MPKVKIARKSTAIDMTAMCDVAFLLLTFFMLTTKFKPQDPVEIITPSSISEIRIPDTDIILITVDTSGRVFFDMDGKFKRKALIDEIDAKYNLQLNENQKNTFALKQAFGVPMQQLGQWLDDPESIKAADAKGIPTDSTDNQLDAWVIYARATNPKASIAIKADAKTPYLKVRRVIDIMQDRKINKFNLITNLELNPNKPQGHAEGDAKDGAEGG